MPDSQCLTGKETIWSFSHVQERGMDEGIPLDCARLAVHDEADVTNLVHEDGIPSPFLNVAIYYFSYSCLNFAK